MKHLICCLCLLMLSGFRLPVSARNKPAFLKPFAYSKSLGDYFLVYKNHHFGLLDSTGRVVVPCRFDDIDAFHEGMAEVVLNGKHGYVDQRGKLVVPLLYDCARRFHNGEALVVTPVGDVGYINRQGIPIAPFSQLGRPYFDPVKSYVTRPYGARGIEGTSEFYIGVAGGDYVPQASPAIDRLGKTGLTIIDGGKKYGLVDSAGHIVFPTVLENADKNQFAWQGWIRIKKEGRYGFFDPQARQVVLPMIYEDTQPSEFAHVWVKQNDKWGMINRQGRVMVPFTYAAVSAYREGRAIVQQNGLFGYVDTTGTLITPVHFVKVSTYQQGKAKAYRGNRWLELDQQGQVIKSGLQNGVLWNWMKHGLIVSSLLLFGLYVYQQKVTLISR